LILEIDKREVQPRKAEKQALIQKNNSCTTSLEISREIKLLADTMSKSRKAGRFAD